MKKILLIFLLFIGIASFAQNEASFWYFGQNAGLQFDVSAGTVTAVIDGQLSTLEGCTSISDVDGNLLFYSDGRTIWNSNHQPMPNASEAFGTELKGDDSSTSSGLIVPKPQDPTKYYLFTVDEPHHSNSSAFPNESDGDGVNNGLMYSLVDLDLEGGLGDVDAIEKNVPLITYDENNELESEFKCSEKITAVKADDCYSFWVITHFTDSFYAFKVTENGVDLNPVVSTVGPEVPVEGYRRNALGYLKASPDGTKLVAAHFGFATVLGENASGGVYLFDFNNDTGVVSNSLELLGPEQNTSPYGVEFSSGNTKVYATTGSGQSGAGAGQLIQWDLLAADIPASQQIISGSSGTTAGALQLGLDKRIYRALMNFSNPTMTGTHLGVINNPEEVGAAVNYVDDGILVDVNNNFQNLSRIGLPPFIQSLFNTQIDIIQNGISTTELLLCNGGNYTLTATEINGATYIWTKDGEELTTETTFQLFVDEPGFYEVFIEPNNGECPIEGEALVEYFEVPIIANEPVDIIECNTTTTFDLTLKDAEILGALNPLVYDVHYFTSIADANNNENEIIGPFTTNLSVEIFVRVNNMGNSDCFDMTSFNIEIFKTPNIVNLNDVIVCDEDISNNTDGITEIDFLQFYSDILGNQDGDLYTITFHLSQEDADNNDNPLPENYTNTTPITEEIFVRIENNVRTICYSTASFIITINPAPSTNDITIFQCDDDGIADGFTRFNIDNNLADITDDPSAVTVTYFLSLDDASNNVDAIDGSNFANFENPQTVYALVTDNASGCSDMAVITLDISTTSLPDTSMEACDDDGNEDGIYAFDLTQAFDPIIDGLPTNLELAFYFEYLDALLEVNPIDVNGFENTIPYNQTIYVRAEFLGSCYGISAIDLVVHELPNIETQEDILYCLNDFPQTITLTGGVIDDLPNNYFYQWSTGATTSEIQVNQAGSYSVTVTNTDGCSKQRVINVVPSNIATIEEIQVTDASENNTITALVSGEGDYEYALDNSFGPYQDSNIFENVSIGFHEVFVRDKNDCGIVSQIVSVIGFPKFFTPNDDDVNDFWQVKGISEQFQPNSLILIFTRYGKILAKLDPLGAGWDGTYNGRAMPSDDYWFSVTLEDGRQFNSHFALRR
ncbi:T9SS type B sorting domain-containing protein [Winogradskyella sp. 3972H.M.0a.05]|uniref:T9SS type B sorting domain-containing protein n=1 Tax=Winogradskyella sp. 3972H.M.0a.05 TaxID=2950277 RepID=UPI00339B6053